jgi:UDP-N-acetyl-D-glucosamine dehydrogenase
MQNMLVGKIKSRSATACVLGLGYVGLPLAIEMVRAGFNVIGIDSNRGKVEALQSGECYVHDVANSVIVDALDTERFMVTHDVASLSRADTVSICVPTPLRKTKDPDLRYIMSAANDVAKHIRPGCLVVLESTTYPGTTEEIVGGALESRGFSIGEDVFVAFSPERVDPGNPVFHTKNTPKVIGGMTPACGRIAAALYECFIDEVVLVSSARVAETVKLLENTFRSVNIGLVNEMSMMCDRMGIDVWEVIAAAYVSFSVVLALNWPEMARKGHFRGHLITSSQQPEKTAS